MINVDDKATFIKDRGVFLSAEWRDLVMLNYVVDPDFLRQYVPAGTSLDSFDGKTYISLVGFRFCGTKLRGRFSVPFHANFQEVNLRFYVRREENKESRRGVVFIAEIVPKQAIALVARYAYGENYKCARMKHHIETQADRKTIEFQWQVAGEWCGIEAQTDGSPTLPGPDTLEQYITEHYWGYSKLDDSCSLEYQVQHVPWQVWRTSHVSLKGDVRAFYGTELRSVLQRPPDSSFVADGSPVTVFSGKRIS